MNEAANLPEGVSVRPCMRGYCLHPTCSKDVALLVNGRRLLTVCCSDHLLLAVARVTGNEEEFRRLGGRP